MPNVEKQDLTPPWAIVPAAGAATRFGGGKLVAMLRGEALIDHTLRSLLDGGVGHIIVVVAPGADFSPSRLMTDRRVRCIDNPDPSPGMFSSLQVGARAVELDVPVLVLPGDMPFVRAATVRAVRDAACAHPAAIVSPRFNGRRGHPIAIPPDLRHLLAHAPTHETLKHLLAASGRTHVELDVEDEGVRRDVDVRGDLGVGE